MADPDSPVRIIIGVDGSHGAKAAVRAVTSRQWPKGSEARVVNGLWSMPPLYEEMEMRERAVTQAAEWSARERRVAEEIVDSAVEQLKAAELVTTAILKEEEPKRLRSKRSRKLECGLRFRRCKGPQPSPTTIARQRFDGVGYARALFS